jgi:serine/threonine-protein kinase
VKDVGDPASPQPPDPRIGSLLQERYRILSKIDSGAMGVVYRGERVQLGRPVAVKFLHPWIAAQKAFLSRFENEAKAMSRLSHPHCVSVIDFGVEGSPFLVMDFVTGRTLRELTQGGRLAVPRALRFTQQLLAGLAHAHAQGIVHRDLKPENLILSDEEGLEEHLRILDFGLAKLRDGPQMTAGMAVGTPSYMSPEQSGADGAIDARTDLYTVGIVLFELLTGKKPFQSENIGELILMQRETLPPHVRDIVPELSPQIDAVVWKAMAKLPEDRYQSAGEMAAALEGTPEARGAGPPPGRPAARAAPPVEKRPARPADATTVDTISAVRRRVGGEKEGTEPVRHWRLAPVAGIFLVFVMVMLLIGRVIRHSGTDGSSTAGTPASRSSEARAPAAAGAPRPAAAPDGQGLERARQLIASHATAEALALLDQLRTTDPANADVPYLQALVYFDNRRIPEAVAAAEVAIGKDPALKSDPDLVKAALRSLANDRGYERSEAFLRTLGPPAQPFIKEAAHRDPSPKVRDRAAELLAGGGGSFRSSARGWSSRPSSGSGPSLFKR